MKKSRSVSVWICSICLSVCVARIRFKCSFKPKDLSGLDVDIRGLPLESSHGLMDQDSRMGKRIPFTLLSRSQKQRRHAGGLPEADGRDLRLDVLHGVVDRQSGRDDSSGRVDVEVDVLVRIFRFQKEELRNNQVGHVVIDGRPQKDDPVFQKAGIDIIGPLARGCSAR